MYISIFKSMCITEDEHGCWRILFIEQYRVIHLYLRKYIMIIQ